MDIYALMALILAVFLAALVVLVFFFWKTLDEWVAKLRKISWSMPTKRREKKTSEEVTTAIVVWTPPVTIGHKVREWIKRQKDQLRREKALVKKTPVVTAPSVGAVSTDTNSKSSPKAGPKKPNKNWGCLAVLSVATLLLLSAIVGIGMAVVHLPGKGSLVFQLLIMGFSLFALAVVVAVVWISTKSETKKGGKKTIAIIASAIIVPLLLILGFMFWDKLPPIKLEMEWELSPLLLPLTCLIGLVLVLLIVWLSEKKLSTLFRATLALIPILIVTHFLCQLFIHQYNGWVRIEEARASLTDKYHIEVISSGEIILVLVVVGALFFFFLPIARWIASGKVARFDMPSISFKPVAVSALLIIAVVLVFWGLPRSIASSIKEIPTMTVTTEPVWTLLNEPGKVPGLAEKLRLDKVYPLEVRNVQYVEGEYIRYDIWAQNPAPGLGKIGRSEYYFDQPFGTVIRTHPKEVAYFYLEPVPDKPNHFKGEAWGEFSKGEKVPIRLFPR